MRDRWVTADKAERNNIIRELVPEEPAMIAIREDIEQRVEGMMRDYDRMGEFFQSNSAW